MEQIQQLAHHYFAKAVEYRRHFHRYPELSGQEQETAAYICRVLDKMDISYESGVAGYGVVATLKGKLPGTKTVALRADMDALPVKEKTGQLYQSVNDGVMHACGHDAHIAILLGTLHVLKNLRDSFGGNVKAIFQPSEEAYEGGAKFMIEQGVLDEVDLIFGLHVTPEIETGSVGICDGPFMASTDEIYFTVHGKGGHAALVNELMNPVLIGNEIITKLSEYIEINKPPEVQTVLSFGRFIAEGLTNLVPDTAEIAGTFRTFDEEWRETAIGEIENIAQKRALLYGASCETHIRRGYPVLINDPEVAGRVRNYAQSILGKTNVLNLSQRMTAEDFAYYLQKKPGLFFRLGSSFPDKALHSSRFDIDEKALIHGMELMSLIAMSELNLK